MCIRRSHDRGETDSSFASWAWRRPKWNAVTIHNRQTWQKGHTNALRIIANVEQKM